jgi:U4/U6 small nuclear ribonucleoprotein PRP3
MDRDHSSNGVSPRHAAAGRVQKVEPESDRLAALRARVAAAVGGSKAKGGLNVGLHPALEDLGQYRPPAKANDAPSSASTQPPSTSVARYRPASTAGRRDASTPSDAQRNPYLEDVASNASVPAAVTGGRGGGGGAGAGATSSARQRHSRRLVFNQKGKYIQQANALRRQAALEDMKRRIAQQTRKVGIDDDADVEKNFHIDDPPDVEWWDEALVDASYDMGHAKIDTLDSIITEYIQHPIALEPPQDKHVPAPKTMYLTPKEQAKLRRQRRMADLKEKQAKIRLGLEPAPHPKVKKGNLMRVLGEEAVKDPTAVEARVNREIAERRQKHLEENEERKLSKEERHEKLAVNQEKDAAKGVHLLVLRIDSLANGQHRFKVGKNAEQLALTGICIMHPRLNLIVVEGGQHSIAKYKKLVLDRIDWSKNAPSLEREDGGPATGRAWLSAEDDKGLLKDLSTNKCVLIFEGEVKARNFRKWGSKVCETDAEARDVLSRTKMENFWSQAKAT